MLVLSRKPAERIFARPHKLAEEAADLASTIGPGSFVSEDTWRAFERIQAIVEQLARDELVVTVIRIGPNVCRLGVDADRGRELLREELIPPAGGEEAAA